MDCSTGGKRGKLCPLAMHVCSELPSLVELSRHQFFGLGS